MLTSFNACDIIFLACTSWPCPIEMDLHFNSSFFASVSIYGVGSEPILKKQTMGVRGRDSLNSISIFSITGSANFWPSELAIYFLLWVTVLSGHHAL